MNKFVPIFDIHAIPAELRRYIKPGQWVYATDKTVRGRFYGVKKSGICVVAWKENAKSSGNYFEYNRIHREYARG